jgi:ABC-type multidrug transport system ATPase subunit
LMSGRTTFVIAHRLSTIRSADQILVLENGEIVERGTHSELLAHAGRYFDLYTRQAGIEANRFINPGEKEPEPELAPDEKGKERRDGLSEVARDLLGFSRSSRG